MVRHRWFLMSVFVVLGLLLSTGNPAAVQQKIRLDVPGVT